MNIPFLHFFKKIRGTFSSKGVMFFWYRHYTAMFFLLFLVVLSLGGWKWYYSLYRYRLSDEEKKRYVEQYFKETTFKEARFRDVVDDLVERRRMHEETLELKRDIFEGKRSTSEN
ncbi:MAG: hypothetical protein WAW00_02340 [Candidatus Moraniibacteriota bacterium]